MMYDPFETAEKDILTEYQLIRKNASRSELGLVIFLDWRSGFMKS